MMIDNIVWKDIPDCDHRYQVSNTGQVKRLAETVIISDGRRQTYKEYLFTPHKSKIRPGKERIRLWVSLKINGKSRTKYISRLVAEAFIPNPNLYSQVNHIDGNPMNNHVSNLEWCTPSENIIHAHQNNLINKALGINNGKAILNSLQATEIYNSTEKNKTIAEKYGIKEGTVWAIKNGVTWSHVTGAVKNTKSLISCQK